MEMEFQTTGDVGGHVYKMNLSVRNKKVIENIFALYLSQGMNYLLPIIIMPYLIRVLGIEKFGLYSVVISTAQYLAVFTDFGFNYTTTRKIAISKHENGQIGNIYSATMGAKSLLLVVSFLGLCLMILVIPFFRRDWSLFLLSFFVVVGNTLFPIWLFQGLEKMRYITISNMLSKSIAIVLIVVLVKTPSDISVAIIIQSISSLFVGLMSIFMVKMYLNVKFSLSTAINFSNIKNELREAKAIFISNMSGNVYNQGALLIVGLISGNVAAGYYAISQKVCSAISSLFQPVAQALYPYICANFIDDNKKIVTIKNRLVSLSFGASMLLVTVLYFNVKNVSLIAIGEYNFVFIRLFKIYMLTLLFDPLNVVVQMLLLTLKEYFVIQKIYLRASLLFLIFSFPAVYLGGAKGMAFVMIVIVELLVFISGLKMLNNKLS